MNSQTVSTITLDEGRRAFQSLLKTHQLNSVDWNEAETRFHFIDQLLTTCLGWPRNEFSLETYTNGQYADYLLGHPVRVIWEAKREGVHFDFPADAANRSIQSLPSLMQASPTVHDAITQVYKYCIDHGVEFAVICNGYQLIAFLAIRIGHPPLKGQALVFRDLNHMKADFPRLWQALSPSGIAERRLHRLLTTGSDASLPPKMSSYLLKFPFVQYQSEMQSDLRSIAELFIQDIPESDDIEERFLSQCYCDTGALSRDSLLSTRLLAARYAALFPDDEIAPRMQPVSTQDEPVQITSDIITESLAKRPIVLLGDVGVGKTTFIKQLMYLRASEEFKRSINVYIDLGSTAALESDLKQFIVRDIERQLLSKYQVDVENGDFVRGVYDLEVKRFRSSIYGKAYKKDKKRYDEQVLIMLANKLEDRPTHLKYCLEHIAKARRRQIIVIFDNADQRPSHIQQEAFIVSQEFAANWNAMVFIAVRPQTFHQSKRAGALSAYPHRVFTIAPPRPEVVIEKRLEFALSIAAGRISPALLRGVSMNFENLTIFLQVLLYSLRNNRDIREILSNITGGNIRLIIEFVVKFIGSPNVDARKITHIRSAGRRYMIPIHEFSKAAILGDYTHFNPESSMAINLFDVQYPDEKEHFLSSLILAFLVWEESPKDTDEFTTSSAIVEEMQTWGFVPRQIEGKLRRLNNKRLIESTERVTFEEEGEALIGDMPTAFRITSIGAYHIKRWVGIFAYLDAMTFDTPIFDGRIGEDIRLEVEEFSIEKRLNRSKVFRDYLQDVWRRSDLSPPYFNWIDVVERNAQNFSQIERVVERMQRKEEENKKVRKKRGKRTRSNP